MIFYPDGATEPPRAPELPGAGWLPDPSQTGLERYWDGSRWTPHTRDRYVPAGTGMVATSTDAAPTYAAPTYAAPAPATPSSPAGSSTPLSHSGPPYATTTSTAPSYPSRTPRSPGRARRFATTVVVLVGLAGVYQYTLTGEVWGAWAQTGRNSVTLGKAPVFEGEYPVFGSTELVNEMERAMLAQETRIDVTSLVETAGIDAVEEAANEAIHQNPYVFTRGWQMRTFVSTTTLMPIYTYSDDEAERRRAETWDAVADGIASANVLRATSDAEKAARVHDFIVATAEYDEAALNAIDRGLDYSLLAQSQEAYGILVEGTAVCGGYAQAFVAMAEAAGLDAVYVTGTDALGLTGDSHAWNKVRVDGRWLLVDTTWDDPLGGVDQVRSDYLLLEDDDPLLETRIADDDWVVGESIASFSS